MAKLTDLMIRRSRSRPGQECVEIQLTEEDWQSVVNDYNQLAYEHGLLTKQIHDLQQENPAYERGRQDALKETLNKLGEIRNEQYGYDGWDMVQLEGWLEENIT